MSSQASRHEPPAALSSLGRSIFSLAIVGLGVETIVCAREATHSVGQQYEVIPVIPWLPAIPWLAYLFGAILVLCALALLSMRTIRAAAMLLGGLLFVCTIVLDFPKYAVDISNISLRTGVFEPLSLACITWLLPDPKQTPPWLALASRYLLAISLIVFGVDHFLALIFIANLIPALDPVPRLLGRILRSCLHRCRTKYRPQHSVPLGRRRSRIDVRHLGLHAAPPQSSWALWHSRGAAQSQRMVQPVDRRGSMGRLVGASPSAGALSARMQLPTPRSRSGSGSPAADRGKDGNLRPRTNRAHESTGVANVFVADENIDVLANFALFCCHAISNPGIATHSADNASATTAGLSPRSRPRCAHR